MLDYSLLLRIEHLDKRLTYSFHHVGVNMIHRVVYGVPCRTERALRAVGEEAMMSMQAMPAFSFTGTWSSVTIAPSFIGKNEP